MKKILIVTANYYKDISLGLLNSAKKNLPRNKTRLLTDEEINILNRS